jgi:DNA (cytosine-5)-methyltransferase 1
VTAFYNEIDPYCAQWLRNLIDAGHIAPGVVVERSIEDITPNELREYTQCHFFAGIGVWSYALRIAGWPDDRPVWTGSCPCQPFSAAGKGHGFADERHLWPAWFHLIRECRPGVVFGEQVASRDGLGWLDLVQADLEGAGYASGAVDLCAAGVGAPHVRQRAFFIADAGSFGSPRPSATGSAGQSGQGGAFGAEDLRGVYDRPFTPGSRHPQPLLRKGDDGYSSAVGRLRAYGNSIHAEATASVISAYMEARQVLAARIAA